MKQLPKKYISYFVVFSIYCSFAVYIFYNISDKFSFSDVYLQDTIWKHYIQYGIETMRLAFYSFVLSIVIGIPVGILKSTQHPLLNWLASFYIYIIHRIPLLVLLYLAVASTPLLLDIPIYLAGVGMLGVYGSYYVSSIIKTCIFAQNHTFSVEIIRKNKIRSIYFLYVFIHLVKQSSLFSLIAIPELFTFAQHLFSYGWESMVIIAIMYIGIIQILHQTVRMIEKHYLIQSDHWCDRALLW